MAKMKTYAVDVEYVVKRTLYVTARRPNGAAEKALTDAGWREGVAYDDEAPYAPPKGTTITRVREVGT